MPDIKNQRNDIKWVYIVFIVIWIALVVFLQCYLCNDSVLWGIIVLPIIFFLIGWYNANDITAEVEDNVFQSDYLALGLIIVFPLLTWVNRDYKGKDRRRFTAILVAAIILSLFSLIDLWVPKVWLPTIKHCKSCLQTMSIVLIIYALYQYYIEKPEEILQ